MPPWSSDSPPNRERDGKLAKLRFPADTVGLLYVNSSQVGFFRIVVGGELDELSEFAFGTWCSFPLLQLAFAFFLFCLSLF